MSKPISTATPATVSTSTPAKSHAPPLGFRFASLAAGVKEPGGTRKDVALIVSETPCAAAGSFTINRMRAAPVDYAAGRLPAAGIRAIVANSGNANAIVGPGGATDERTVAKAVAKALGAKPDEVLTASTGAIGVRLPADRIAAAVPRLVAALGDDVVGAAEAIRTTDTRTKLVFREIDVGGKTVRLAAIAKGSGMIHPQMATMLCFITTDAQIAPVALQTALASAVEDTFNTVTVDGDMSTNDCVIALANGASGAAALEAGTPYFDKFQAALVGLCAELARAIAADGEGATRLLVVDVAGAPGPASSAVTRLGGASWPGSGRGWAHGALRSTSRRRPSTCRGSGSTRAAARSRSTRTSSTPACKSRRSPFASTSAWGRSRRARSAATSVSTT